MDLIRIMGTLATKWASKGDINMGVPTDVVMSRIQSILAEVAVVVLVCRV